MLAGFRAQEPLVETPATDPDDMAAEVLHERGGLDRARAEDLDMRAVAFSEIPFVSCFEVSFCLLVLADPAVGLGG